MIIQLADHTTTRRRAEGRRSLARGSARRGHEARAVEKRVRVWLEAYIAGRLGVHPDEVDPSIPYECYGFGSVEITAMAIALERWMGRSIPRSLLAVHQTIEALARHASRIAR